MQKHEKIDYDCWLHKYIFLPNFIANSVISNLYWYNYTLINFEAKLRTQLKGCLDWDSFATFLRLFSDADTQVRKRRDSFASTQATQLCRVQRVGWPTHSRLLHGGVILSDTVDTTERGYHHDLLPYIKIFCSLTFGKMEIAI